MAAALEQTMHDRGIPALGIWAQVPHYVASMSFPAASVALLDALAEVDRHRRCRRASCAARSCCSANGSTSSSQTNDEHREMVARLESSTTTTPPSTDPAGRRALGAASGDELAAEVEHFLREHPKG